MTAFEAALPEALDGERLDRVVAMLCDLPRAVAAGLVDDGGVSIDGAVQRRRSTRLREGQVVALDVPEAEPEFEVVPDAGVDFDVIPALRNHHVCFPHYYSVVARWCVVNIEVPVG